MKPLTCIRNILSASSITGLSLLASLASARTVLYEGFDNPSGDIDGSQADGTGPIANNAADKPVTLSGGEGIGVSIKGNVNDVNIHGDISDGGLASYSTGFPRDANGANTAGVVEMIAGKIEWAANGSNDTLRLFHISDPDSLTQAAVCGYRGDMNCPRIKRGLSLIGGSPDFMYSPS